MLSPVSRGVLPQVIAPPTPPKDTTEPAATTGAIPEAQDTATDANATGSGMGDSGRQSGGNSGSDRGGQTGNQTGNQTGGQAGNPAVQGSAGGDGGSPAAAAQPSAVGQGLTARSDAPAAAPTTGAMAWARVSPPGSASLAAAIRTQIQDDPNNAMAFARRIVLASQSRAQVETYMQQIRPAQQGAPGAADAPDTGTAAPARVAADPAGAALDLKA